jgi:hypothetical protein
MLENNLDQNMETKKFCFVGEFLKKNAKTGEMIQTNQVCLKFKLNLKELKP